MISTPTRHRPRRNRLARALIATVLAIGITVAAPASATGLASTASNSSAATADGEPRLRAVRFELIAVDRPADGPLSPSIEAESAHYAELQVDHGGVARRLRPMPGAFSAVPATAPAGMAVEIEGLRIGSAADDFDQTIGDVVASPSIGSFVRFDTSDIGEPAAVDIGLPRPLNVGDYLLVQEAGGDDAVDLVGLDAFGQTTGPVRTVTAPYGWNSGRVAADGSRQWASIVDPSGWIGGEPVTTIRIAGAKAEVKVLVLEPATGVIPLPLADTDTGTGNEGVADVPDEAAPSLVEVAAPVESNSLLAGVDEPPTAVPATGSASTQTVELTPVEPVPAPEPVPVLPAQTPEVDEAAPPVLAMTGVSTEPWVLVALATGLIFFGYTTFVAFRRPAHQAGPGEPKGHDQLDALGFD